MDITPNLWLPYILLGITPGIIWMFYYLREDKKNPEPKGKILQIFLWGMLATIPAICIEIALNCAFGYSCSATAEGSSLYFNPLLANTIIYNLIFVFAITAITEEACKYMVVQSQVLKNIEFDEPVDAMIYCIVGALGFASAENILFTLTSGNNPFPVVTVRFFTAVLIHALTGGIIGYYIGKVKLEQMKQSQFMPGIKSTRKSFWSLLTGIIIAIALHGIYNFLVLQNTNASMLEIIALIMTTAFLVSLGFDKLKNNPLAANKSMMYNINSKI